MFKIRSIQEVDFPNWCISFQMQKYTWSRISISMYLYWNSKVYLSRLSKLMYLSSNSEVYFKQTFNIDVFIFKPRSILEVDFRNLSIYVQTQKKILEAYFVSKKVKKYLNEVLLKYKHGTFLFYFLLFLYFTYTSF